MMHAGAIEDDVRRVNALEVEATVTFRVHSWLADRGSVFDFVAAEDVLPVLMTGYGVLPGVVRTSGLTGPWDEPGSSRTIHLDDGTTALEELTAYERPAHFAYRTSRYTYAVRFFATWGTGEWWFEALPEETLPAPGSRVRWTYTFHAPNRVMALLLWLFVRFQWIFYMRGCALNVQQRFAG